MCFCTTCEFDLRNFEPEKVNFIGVDSREMFCELVQSVQDGNKLTLDVEHLAVLRQFCKLINSSVTGNKLSSYLIKHLQIHADYLLPNHMTFELADISHRHKIIQLAIWILYDWELRLENIWANKILCFNMLLKDMSSPPNWYTKYCYKFNRNM